MNRHEKHRLWHEWFDYHAIATIKHSGTVSLQQLYPPAEYRFLHCEPPVLEYIDTLKFLATTYRDPYRIAASWLNRGQLETDADMQEWHDAWIVYQAVVRKADEIYPVKVFPERLNTARDKFEVHKALDTENFEYYHSLIDKTLIDHALKCLKPVKPIIDGRRKDALRKIETQQRQTAQA